MTEAKLVRYNVEFPETPAVHAKLTEALIAESHLVKCMLTVRLAGKTVIQFLAPEDPGLIARLDEIGITVARDPVVALNMPREPAALRKLAASLSAHGIPLEAIVVSEEGPYVRVVFGVQPSRKAMTLIRELGFNA